MQCLPGNQTYRYILSSRIIPRVVNPVIVGRVVLVFFLYNNATTLCLVHVYITVSVDWSWAKFCSPQSLLQRDIYNNTVLLVELCVAKLDKDGFVLLELLALVFNPQSRQDPLSKVSV